MTDEQASSFGPLLKFWRKVHGLSQESLALAADSSTRHISCLENGKSHPSRAIIAKIAEVLELKQRDKSYLLLAAGYLPLGEKVDFHDSQYNWLRKAMLLTLKAMDPFPAALMDRYGTLLMVNRAWVGFHSAVVGSDDLAQVKNHFSFLFSRQHSRAQSEVKENTLALMIMAMQQEYLLSNDPIFLQLFQELAGAEDAPSDWAQRAAKLDPQSSFRIQIDLAGKPENFFNVSQTVGALGPASFVSEPRLIITTLYPENDHINMNDYLTNEVSHPLLLY